MHTNKPQLLTIRCRPCMLQGIFLDKEYSTTAGDGGDVEDEFLLAPYTWCTVLRATRPEDVVFPRLFLPWHHGFLSNGKSAWLELNNI